MMIAEGSHQSPLSDRRSTCLVSAWSLHIMGMIHNHRKKVNRLQFFFGIFQICILDKEGNVMFRIPISDC